MTADIEKLEALLAKATPLPWVMSLEGASIRANYKYTDQRGTEHDMTSRVMFGHDRSAPQRAADFGLIVGTINALPALIAHIRDLQGKLAVAENRMGNLGMGLEEIRDAAWPGDDAIDRIRKCADYWLSGDEEKLDAFALSTIRALPNSDAEA